MGRASAGVQHIVGTVLYRRGSDAVEHGISGAQCLCKSRVFAAVGVSDIDYGAASQNEWPPRCTISDVVYLVLLAACLYILLHGARLDTERGPAIQVAAQKIIVHASIVNLGYQALGIRGGALEARGESQVG
jgi:hypothetical protein